MPPPAFGTCEVLSPLGAGGMGEVYRARDTALGRDVAVKVLPPGFAADPDRLRRFEQEARAAAALNHPNILAVYDVGEQDGAPYIVSELLEGETLRDRLRAGALPVRKAVDYAAADRERPGGRARQGHRPSRPEAGEPVRHQRRPRQDPRLRPREADAPGRQRRRSASRPRSRRAPSAGMVLGTVGYMSPEQVRGQPVDARTDIFSLGAMLYEMVSGKRAFQGDTPADTMSAILREEPPPLTAAVDVRPAGARSDRAALPREESRTSGSSRRAI